MSSDTPNTPDPNDPQRESLEQHALRRQDEQHLQIGHDVSADPTDGYEPVPLWLMTIFGAFLAWGGWYIGTYNAGWNWLELDETMGGHAVLPPSAADDPIALGKRIFSARCVSCHQADGKGLPNQYPTLHATEWVLGNPAWMKRIVLQGLEGPIEVAGNRYNGAMPGFAAQLNDKQIAAVISYVRTNADWGNTATPVGEESVAATREAVKSRTTPWSASELLAITIDEGPPPVAPPAVDPSAPAQPQPTVPANPAPPAGAQEGPTTQFLPNPRPE